MNMWLVNFIIGQIAALNFMLVVVFVKYITT